jgi:hypothetical protein
MALTVDTLKTQDLGYLSGADLLQWCPAQILIKQYEVDNNSLVSGANYAYAEITSALINRYDIATELNKSNADGDRVIFCVKLTAILAIRNALGNMANVSEYMMEIFKGAKKDLMDIRNGQLNLPLALPPQQTFTDPDSGQTFPVKTEATARLIRSSFSTLG